MALLKQNFHVDSEAGINKQINLHLYSSFVYQSMAFYFDRGDVALPGFHKLFKSNSDKERELAEKLMKYQNKRGGRIVLKTIDKPETDEWGTGLDALQGALTLEKNLNQCLLTLHGTASNHNDSDFTSFLESEFLQDKVLMMKQLSDHVTQLKRVGACGVGEYMFDHETLSG